MVKIPEPAPTGVVTSGFLDFLRDNPGQLTDVVRQANQDDYLYWDSVKYLNVPDGVSHEDTWRLLKLMRSLSPHRTPVFDSAGQSYSYVLTEGVQKCLHNIDRWAAGWDTGGSGLTSEPQKERFIITSLMDEAIASSQIEGAATTRKKAREMLLRKLKPRNHGERMVLNNYRTILRVRELADADAPITPDLIIGLQASMTVDTLADPDDVGRLRTNDDYAVFDETNQELYAPISHAEVPTAMRGLCEYANDDSGPFVHPAIKAITLHFWLALIHPFADGNGRTARALFYLYMLKKGYWLFQYLSISRVIHRRRAQYERAYLYAERDDADFTYFLVFHLRAIEQALDEMRKTIARKVADDRRLQTKLQTEGSINHRQLAVLNRALRNPDAMFTHSSHASAHGVVVATARTDLLDLAERGYLVRGRQGREFVFTPASDLRDRVAAS